MKRRQHLFLFLIMTQLFLIPSLVQYGNIESNPVYNDIPSITDVSVGPYTVPGVIMQPSDLIKIGILGDTKRIAGVHAWNGAFLAAKEINQAGGISIGGITYFVGLVSEDTDEENYNLDVSKGVAAADKMVNQHAPDFIVGGYRTEALLAYLEVIMDNHIPFISIGSDTDYLCQNVLDNYARYKYFFRIMPLNSTSFAGELIYYLISLSSYLGTQYGGTINKVAILREDLSWTLPWSGALNAYLPMFGMTVVEEIAFPITATATDMGVYLAQIDAAGAQITIPLISGQTGLSMMMQYEIFQPGFLVVGIDKQSQYETTWADSNGACQYEVIPQPVYKTNKTSLTLPFWNNFLDAFDEEPFYTGAGAYDSIKLLIEAANETQNLNPDIIIGELEGFNANNPFHGASGTISFTGSHDILEGWPYNTYLFCQWNSYGNKEVVSTYNQVYPDSITTGDLKIPFWGINNLTGPQALPGGFTLSSDASVPDTDGSFNLSWSSSVGANSYSIYYSNQPNLKRLVKIADNATSSFKISNLMTDEYYFVIVAHNSVGEALSNSLYINVERPRPGSFILYTDSDSPDPDGQFNLTWSASEGANNYSVYGHYSNITVINQSLTIIADQTGVSPYNISGLTDGLYYFAVEAHNKTGKTLSNCIEVEVQFPSPPGNFTLFSSAETPDSDGNFDLNWTASDGALNYSVYEYSSYITDINGSLTLLGDEITDTSLALSGYTDGTYYFIIVAHNAWGDTLSNCIEVVVQFPPPGNFVLSSNAGTPDDNGAFNLSWANAVGAESYSVYEYSSYITKIDGNLTLLIAGTIDLTLPISIYSNGTYYFIVVAHNAYGDTLSNCLEVIVQIPPPSDGPIISIIAPTTNQQLEISPIYEITVEDLNLDTIWYTLDGGENNFTVTELTGIINQELWNDLPNGYVTIRFYANDTLGNVNYDDVIVVKNTPAPQDEISGYDVVILLGMISVITLYLTKRKFSKKY